MKCANLFYAQGNDALELLDIIDDQGPDVVLDEYVIIDQQDIDHLDWQELAEPMGGATDGTYRRELDSNHDVILNWNMRWEYVGAQLVKR